MTATIPEIPEDAIETFATPERRIEGPLKVTGRARYSADVVMPGMLWAAFTISTVPHARIVSVDTSEALKVPGVHVVLTGQDVGDARLGRRLMDWPVLARDRVLFIGDRVAAVAAETKAAAQEAAALVRVEYAELPAIFEPEQALADGAPILHPDADKYIYLGKTRPPVPHPNLQGYNLVQKGEPDMEKAFAAADHVFEGTFTTPRQHQGYIEPRATLVWIEGETVYVQSTNKAPFALRQQLSRATGVAPDNIVVRAHFIGGDFGGKGLSIDEFVAYFLARATGRPIKCVMSYVDELQATAGRHSSIVRMRTGVTKDGRFVAHQSEVFFNAGAYAGGKPGEDLLPPGGVATLAAYNVPNTRLEVKGVYTNTVPAGHMRAPGEVQAIFAGESHVDDVARALGIDPMELRLRNAIRSGQSGPANERFRQPRAVEVLEALKREVRWGEEPLPPDVGRGLGISVRHIGGGKTSVVYRLLPGGMVEVLTAVPDQGSGSHTVIRRVAASVLSVPEQRITVRFGDTATAPLDPGSGGSRVTHIAGQAAQAGAVALKRELQNLAAEVLGWPSGRVEIRKDAFVNLDAPSDKRPFAKVADQISRGSPVEISGAYDGDVHHDEGSDFNFAAFMAEVHVDRETGAVDVRDIVFSADVGAILNPVAHQGQIDGGFVYGLGGALMEELPIEDGKVTALNLGEYKLPTQMDTPPFRTVLVPTEVGPGPWGAKMAGEVSQSGVAPAIANAIRDAVGVRLTSLPVSAEKILANLQAQA